MHINKYVLFRVIFQIPLELLLFMFKNIFQYTIAPLIIVALSGGVYFTKLQSNELIQSFLVVLISGVFVTLFFTLLNLSILILKYRYWIFGTLFGIFVFFQHTILVDFHTYDHFISDLIISTLIGNLSLGTLLYFRYRDLKSKTRIAFKKDEVEVASISGNVRIERYRKSGRFILTNRRIIFMI